MTPPTGQPSDADLARWETWWQHVRPLAPVVTVTCSTEKFVNHCLAGVPRLLDALRAERAAVRDRDARIAELTAQVERAERQEDGDVLGMLQRRRKERAEFKARIFDGPSSFNNETTDYGRGWADGYEALMLRVLAALDGPR